MPSFDFIHAADLHIDSPFKGITAGEAALTEVLQRSTLEAFDNLIDECLQRKVDFLVIAGDVYDSQDRSIRAQHHLRNGLARLGEAGIRSFIVHGNHDPLESRMASLEWPEQARFFERSVEYVTVQRDGEPLAVVGGISFPKREETRNLAARFKRQPGGLFHVGLLHCNVGGDAGHDNYAPCTLDDLEKAGMDYWALGHVHTRQVLSKEPYVAYPGNPQGRSIREQDPRGCNLVHVEGDGQVEVEFVPLDVVRWGLGRVSIEDVETTDAIEAALLAKAEAMSGKAEGRGLICRLAVEGRGSLHAELRRSGAMEQLLERLREQLADEDPFIWVQALEVATRPDVGLGERRQRQDLVAEVLGLALEARQDPAVMASMRFEALDELWRDRRMLKAKVDPPSDDEIGNLLEETEWLCLDLLEEEP